MLMVMPLPKVPLGPSVITCEPLSRFPSTGSLPFGFCHPSFSLHVADSPTDSRTHREGGGSSTGRTRSSTAVPSTSKISAYRDIASRVVLISYIIRVRSFIFKFVKIFTTYIFFPPVTRKINPSFR